MTRYRLYCGLKDNGGAKVAPKTVKSFLADVARQFPGFTVYRARGYWKGADEATMIVELLEASNVRPTVDTLAKEYASIAHQDAVLVTAERISSKLVA